MPTTILVVTDNLKDQVNGVVTTFNNIESHARNDGYDIVYLDPRQFRYIDCPGYPEVKLSWPSKIDSKIQTINPDYIHIATEGPIGLAVKLYCDRNSVPYNTSYHTKFPEFLKRIYHVPEWLTYGYMRWFHKRSQRVLTTTETMVKELREHKFVNNIFAWTRGVDRTLFSSAFRTSTKTKEPMLLSVGRVSKEKGLDDFCQLPYANKIVVGDGPYRAELERKYPTVKFVGVKRGQELAEYYSNADVFVFPSQTDTFGIVIIESLACGTPVAAYPVAGPKDILIQGITGSMNVNLVDSVEHCLTLKRSTVAKVGASWNWGKCWAIFKEHLVPVKN